jgi:hypothetical protein
MKILEKENERLHKQVYTFAELLKSSMSKATGNNLTYIVNTYGSALRAITKYKYF